MRSILYVQERERERQRQRQRQREREIETYTERERESCATIQRESERAVQRFIHECDVTHFVCEDLFVRGKEVEKRMISKVVCPRQVLIMCVRMLMYI